MNALTTRSFQYLFLALLGGLMAWLLMAFLRAVQPPSTRPATSIDPSYRKALEQELEKADSGTVLRSISGDLKEIEKNYDFREQVDEESLRAPEFDKDLGTP